MAEEKTKAAEAALARESEGSDETAEVVPHDDKTREFRHLGLARLRFDWSAEDAPVMAMIMQQIEDRLEVAFTDAFQILNDIYDVVREPACDEHGVIMKDRYGWTIWAQSDTGHYIEDYSRLGIKERDNFIQQITTRLFEWEQRAADAWTEAMFAKAEWEQRFSHEFLDDSKGGRKTDEAMTNRARSGSREERYFALYLSGLSRKADVLVRSMDRMAMRLSQSVK